MRSFRYSDDRDEYLDRKFHELREMTEEEKESRLPPPERTER